MNRMKIDSKKEFIQFLKLFIDDYNKNKDEWENNDLKTYFEALFLYLEDIDGFYINLNENVDPEKASWQLFHDAMMGARIYE